MSFDFQTVFSSVQDFFASGYVFLIFGALLALSIIKKLVKLMILAIIIGLVWAVAVSMTGGIELTALFDTAMPFATFF